MLLVLPMAGTAIAAPPTGSFLNPSTGGPSIVISNKADGTDSLYHFNVSAIPDPGTAGATVSSVTIYIKDCNDTAFRSIGSATKVGTTDVWEFKWNMSADADPTQIAACATGAVAALATQSNSETGTIPAGTNLAAGTGGLTVNFRDATAETVEITSPANGALAGFSGADCDGVHTAATCAILVSGTASSVTGDVDVFYTKSAPGTVPTWIQCVDTGAAVTSAAKTAGTPNTWSTNCGLAANDAGAAVTGVAARDDADANNAATANVESGDAHRITSYAQIAQQLTVTPASDTQTVNFCNTYTAKLLDTLGNPIIGAPVDINAIGPADSLHFAWNNLDTAATGDTQSDNGPTTVAPGAHTEGGVAATFEAQYECDGTTSAAWVAAPDNDGVAENAGGTDASDGTPAAGERGAEGVHVAAGSDTKHLVGQTDADGFQFSIISPDTAGTTNLTAWNDANGNFLNDNNELTGTASKNWATASASSGTLTATPANAVNPTGSVHTVTATVKDQNGNPIANQPVAFRVTAGPNASGDLDSNGSTTGGYFGSCNTAANGTCSKSYTGGATAGTDTIVVFEDTNLNTNADTGEKQTTVTKQWVPSSGVAATCIDVDPNTKTNPTTGTHTVTVFVTNGTYNAANDTANGAGVIQNDCSGTAVSGVGVTFSFASDQVPDTKITSGDTDSNEDTETVVTAANGSATVTLVNKTAVAGVNNWTGVADVIGTANECTADGTTCDNSISKTWAVAGLADSITCAPKNDLNPTGTVHTLSATVIDPFGTPLANQKVDFFVNSDTGTGNSGRDLDSNGATPVGWFGNDVLTNSAGTASASYTGNTAGTDTLICMVDNDSNNGVDLNQQGNPMFDSATKQWQTAATIAGSNVEIDMIPQGGGVDDTFPGSTNTAICNANLADLSDQTAPDAWEGQTSGNVNTVELVCVGASTATVGGTALVGATVTLTSTGVGSITDNNGPAPAVTTQTAVIDNTGYAKFYVFSTKIGAQTLHATISGVTDSDTATKTWQVDPFDNNARIIDCSPEAAQNKPGTNHTITCITSDGFGNPVQGVTTTFTRTDTAGANSSIVGQQTTSDGNGMTFITISSSSQGVTTVSGTTAAAPATECGAAAGVDENGAAGNDVGKPAGVCSDGVTKTWTNSPSNNGGCWSSYAGTFTDAQRAAVLRLFAANGRHGYAVFIITNSHGGRNWRYYKKFCDAFALANANRETSRNRAVGGLFAHAFTAR